MTNKQTLMAILLIAAGCIAYSAYAYTILPPIIPSHWNVKNQVDGYSPKGMMLLPLLAPLCIPAILSIALPWLRTKDIDRERFERTFRYVLVLLAVFLAFQDVLVLYMMQHPRYSFARALMIGTFILLALVGNVLGKMQPNRWSGIRTRWTLASESVWRSTHRMAGPLWVVCSAIAVIWLALGGSLLMPMVVVIPMILVPILYSYLLFKEESAAR
jgi:uncharacterized membrane protein